MPITEPTRSIGSAILDRGQGEGWPPVLILNMFYSGLGIARQLAGKGMRVIGLSADDKTYGNFTRLCDVRRVPNSKDDPEGLAEFLLKATDLENGVIFPTRDADVMFLDHFRTDLEAKYRLAIPPVRCLRRSIDKQELVCAAKNAGIPVPRTLRICSAEDLGRVGEEVGFPCVLKPVSSLQWHLGDAWQKVGGRKAIQVDCWESLKAEYRHIEEVTPQVLVQEWIPGNVREIVVLGGYVNECSELLTYFTSRKILQSPDDCGTGCIVRSEPIDDIVEPSQILFRELQYQGMAEVEYKYDVRTQEYKLIEINTRHWDQHQLGDASGVNLSWVAYCHLTGKTVLISRGPINVATWIAEDVLVKRLIRSMVRPELRITHLRESLSGTRMYAIFDASDLSPFSRYFLGTMIPELAGRVLKRVSRTFRSPS